MTEVWTSVFLIASSIKSMVDKSEPPPSHSGATGSWGAIFSVNFTGPHILFVNGTREFPFPWPCSTAQPHPSLFYPSLLLVATPYNFARYTTERPPAIQPSTSKYLREGQLILSKPFLPCMSEKMRCYSKP